MSMYEYDEFQDFVESLEDKKMSSNKQMRQFAIWVGEHIYGLNPKENTVSVGFYMKLLQETMELTNAASEEELKN